MGNSLSDVIKEALLPSEEKFVIGEVAANEGTQQILALMSEGYSYLEAKEKLESDRRAKVEEQFEKEIDALEREDNDPSGICVWHRDEPGDFDW